MTACGGGRSANWPFPLSARDQGSLEIKEGRNLTEPRKMDPASVSSVFLATSRCQRTQSLVEDVVSCVIDTPLCSGRRTRAGWADPAGGVDPLDETRASKYPRSRGFCRQQQPRNCTRLWSGLARQNLANDLRAIGSFPGRASIVLDEWSALRVDKLGLRGLEAPFATAPLGGADIYLNAFRGVLADQRCLLRRRKFGRNVLSDRDNRRERKSSKAE